MHRIAARGLLLSLGLTMVLGVALSARASAAQDTSTTNNQAEIDQCLNGAPIGSNAPPSCVFDANGHLLSRSTSSPGVGGSSINLAPFFFLALLWSVVPLVIAMSVASSRGEPLGSAVLLTIVFGWIGLFIVLYGQRRTAEAVGRMAHAPPTTVGGVDARTSAAERLRTIDDLFAQRLITGDERDQRRSAVLDELGGGPSRATP
jgi:hypothetical protein